VSEVTRLLDAVDRGEPQAAEELLPLVYQELRRLAAAKMAENRPGQTLQPTALVHEAWLRLLGSEQGKTPWNGRGHFFGAAAEAMRRILIDHARHRLVRERSESTAAADRRKSDLVFTARPERLLAVHEVLDQLAAEDQEAANLVKLRYFAGMTMTEAAGALGLPLRTAERIWTFARTWLRHQIQS
jgi:RNA polymerase sigma factor (TIGR02999 family)